MKLGTKIALGFMSLIGIAVLLGGMAIWNMKSVEGETSKLAQEYVPEVQVANNLRGAANRTMYGMRGYSLTENPKYYEDAKTEMSAVANHLKEAEDLANTAIHLQALKGQVETASSAIDTYSDLMGQTETLISKLAQERENLNKSAAAYMENSAAFLNGQNEAFEKDLDERQTQITTVTDIVNLGTTVRVTNFKAQASNDIKLMQNAIDALAALSSKTVELRKVTRDPADIQRIENVEAAAKAYSSGMENYVEISQGLAEDRETMNRNAVTYMTECNAFLAGQNDKMLKEIKEGGADLTERLKKINLANDIIAVGNAGRILNFKGQAEGNTEYLLNAIDTIKGAKKSTADLRAITRDDVDLRRIDSTEAAAEKYCAAMELFLKRFAELSGVRSTMDKAASAYVQNCQTFLEGQQAKLSTDMHERHQKISLVNDVISLANDTRIKAFKSQALRSPAIMNDAKKNFAKMDEKYAELRKITRAPADLETIEKTKQNGDDYNTAMTAFLEGWIQLQDLAIKRDEASKQVIAACKTTAEAGMKNTDKIAKDTARELSTATMVMTIGLAIAVVLGILLAFFITRGITKPLNRIIASLNEGADQVNDAANQVSSSSQQQAAGSSEQAASLEETSSALEEMAAMTRTNAENAKQANELSGQARAAAETGDRTMEQLNSAMSAINESSGQISKIIKVIEEIAFQTNLLALNAAVEAARAGEHGKGFAVVADEVRNLALRAAEAARETTGLIEESVDRAKEGTVVANDVGSALGAIVDDVTKVTCLIEGIATASVEQAQGVEQVNVAVSDMDQVTQSNAAGAEESAAAAEELSAQASAVKRIVQELAVLVSGAQGSSTRELTNDTSQAVAQDRTYGNISKPSNRKSGVDGSGVPSGASNAAANEFLSLDQESDLRDF